MSIPTTVYRGFALRAYSQKIFPTYHDPYASGPKEFTSVVLIDAIPADPSSSKRYATVFQKRQPADSSEAIAMAIQFGKDIIDGSVHPRHL